MILTLKYTKDRLNLCKKKLKKTLSFLTQHFRTIMYSLFLFKTWSIAIIDYFTVARHLSKKNNDVLPYSPHHKKATVQEKGHLPVKDTNHKISITRARKCNANLVIRVFYR